MDPSSVITQVTPDNNDASHLFTVQKGNGVQQKGKLTYLDSKNPGFFFSGLIRTTLSIYGQICIFSETKKRSNFFCSIICCLGKKSSKYKGGKKERGSFSTGKGNGGSGASGSGDICPDSKQNSQSKTTKQLLPEIRADDVGKKCIVIDLDETLVHSSFKVI